MFKKLNSNIIAIDFDEVLASTFSQVLDFAKNNWHLSWIYFDDLTMHYWWEIPDVWISQEQMLDIWWKFYESDEKNNIKPVIWSQNAINKLKKMWYELHIITARWDELKESTINWIELHFPWIFTEIHFSNYHTPKQISKAEFCKKLWTNLIIEDNLDYSLEIADSWINVYLIEKPWNINRTETHPNIKKVKNWDEIINNLN